MICELKSTKLNDSKVFLSITSNSFKHESFVYTQLNDQIVLVLNIQFCICHLFALNLIVKHFYLTPKWNPIMCYHSGPEWIRER